MASLLTAEDRKLIDHYESLSDDAKLEFLEEHKMLITELDEDGTLTVELGTKFKEIVGKIALSRKISFEEAVSVFINEAMSKGMKHG